MSRLLTPDQAAERLAVHRTTIYKMVKAGQLAAVRLGERSLRIREADLDKLVAEHLVEVSA